MCYTHKVMADPLIILLTPRHLTKLQQTLDVLFDTLVTHNIEGGNIIILIPLLVRSSLKNDGTSVNHHYFWRKTVWTKQDKWV